MEAVGAESQVRNLAATFRKARTATGRDLHMKTKSRDNSRRTFLLTKHSFSILGIFSSSFSLQLNLALKMAMPGRKSMFA